MSLLRQVGLLTKKDLLVVWRSKGAFFLEMLFGLLILPLIAFIVLKASTNEDPSSSFDAVRIKGNYEDESYAVKNIARVSTRWCENQSFAYTSSVSRFKSDVREIMGKVAERYNGGPKTIRFVEFADVSTMRQHLVDDLNATLAKLCHHYIGGVSFANANLSYGQLEYTFFVPQTAESRWKLTEFWQPDGPYSIQADRNSIPGHPAYWQSGLLSLQFAIDSVFLLSRNGSAFDNYHFYLQRMPTPKVFNNGVVTFFKQTHLLWALALMGIMIYTAMKITEEKESGIKTYMMAMGLNPLSFYASQFIMSFVKMFIIITLCAGVFGMGLQRVSASLFLAFSLTYGIGAIMLAIFVTVIVRRPPVAVVSVIGLGILLIVIDNMVKVALKDVGYCFLASLNMYTAFRLGIKAASNFEMRLVDLGWTNMFAESSHSFSFGMAFLMLKLDILILILLICYLDTVIPTDDAPRQHPLFFLKSSAKETSTAGQVPPEDQPDVASNQPEDGMNPDEADIDVRRIGKTWPATNQAAVENLSFRAYRKQVTVLLGHNGAGKSTTFSVISGSTTPTYGDVLICGESITNYLRLCQKKIGYCPQYNPLFLKLSVREHLELYAQLKNDDITKQQVAAEINEILDNVGLLEEKDKLARNLSGGMKRKLCVAMSLIGRSQVILLDEPTEGMDASARNDVSKLLNRVKQDNRTILLTTHNMNEADTLGDRIGIMVKGRLVCQGSNSFLKERFGTGYILSIVVTTDPSLADDRATFTDKINQILTIIRKYSTNATVDPRKTSYPQISIVLPTEDKKHFVHLFKELETTKESLHISSFGLSYNTMEQVFLSVGEHVDPTTDETDSASATRRAEEILRSDEHPAGFIRLWLHQCYAVLKRLWLNAYRNKLRTLLPIVFSVILFVGFAALVRQDSEHKDETLDLSLTSIEPISLPIRLSASHGSSETDFPFIAKHMNPHSKIISVPPTDNLTAALVKHSYDSPPLGIGASVETAGPYTSVYALFNGAAYHTPPLALSFVSNAILKKEPDSVKMSIEAYSVPFSEPSAAAIMNAMSNMVVAVIVIITFSSLTSTFAMVIVDDRESHFKHQLLFTRLHVLTYWLCVTLWNLLLYVIFCVLLCCVFIIFGWMKSCLTPIIVLWALYFWCCIPFVYCVSFLFNSSIRAFAGILSWNMIISLIAAVAITMLNVFQDAGNLNSLVQTVAYLLLPSFALGNGIVNIALQCSISPELPFSFTNRINTCMFVSGAFFWLVLALKESKKIAVFCHRLNCRLRRRGYQAIESRVDDETIMEDDDVIRERTQIRTASDQDYALVVRDISKYYGDVRAVNKLTFGVRQTDCFGLLGINGAGKTTTFDMLTGLSLPTSGRATIGGIDVTDDPVLSYCPQFDALARDLTGRETLSIIAELNGYEKPNERVDNILWCVHLIDHADKPVQYYSGGQRRRLSIGVTLISRSPLIMLDEPTAGIDPRTRRHIWDLLNAIRLQNVAILLTSHSMDECEALCNNIGFMNKGTLVSIGTSQHLKSRYGNSFVLTYTLANPDLRVGEILNGVVQQEFGVNATVDPLNAATLQWEIARNDQKPWSWSLLYEKAQRIAEKYPSTNRASVPEASDKPRIEDFSVTQNSLEQVFLRLSQLE